MLKMRCKEFTSYLIVLKGVNDVTDQIDLQSVLTTFEVDNRQGAIDL